MVDYLERGFPFSFWILLFGRQNVVVITITSRLDFSGMKHFYILFQGNESDGGRVPLSCGQSSFHVLQQHFIMLYIGIVIVNLLKLIHFFSVVNHSTRFETWNL